MKTIEAKMILTKTQPSMDWFNFDYTMNLYKGCCHGCIYCDSRSRCYRIDHFDTVRVKENALVILNRELKGKKKKGIVGIGAMSDTYNPFEKELELTRQALKLIEYYGFGVVVTTKSDLVIRDIDLLKAINEKQSVCVNLTITTIDDELCKKIEPHAPVSSLRFEAIRQCSEAGLFTGILMNPVLPFISDTEENIRGIVSKASECGARFIYTFMGVTLRENQRDYYYQQLTRLFPGLKDKYEQVYKNRYHCESIYWRQLYAVFKEECEKHGILYKMEDIIQAYQKEQVSIEQTSLFDL